MSRWSLVLGRSGFAVAFFCGAAVARPLWADGREADLEKRVRALEQRLQAREQGGQERGLSQRVTQLEQELKGVREKASAALGVDIHGFVSGSYNYNFNSPDSRANGLAVFHPDANSFQLDQFNLYLGRQREKESVGFVVNLDFGKVAEVVGGVTNWSNSNNTERQNSIELREAYLTYQLPIDLDIKVSAGKFVTKHGAEIIENWDNHNYNITRSFNFGFGIPFTHTGIMTTTKFNDVVSLDLGIVNGWDNVVDNNDGKSVHGGLSVAPSELFNVYISGIYGPEQSNNGHSRRALTTLVATLKPHEQITLVGELTYGSEEDAKLSNPTETAEWYGGAGYVVAQLADDLQFVVRGEVFDDTDGSRFAIASVPNGVTAWAVTPTVAYRLTEGLLWRTEYRHDNASAKIFDHDGNLNSGQDQILTQLIYSF
ncbi:MAG: porin [Candidatus Binatia bacterium]|nr:porin [Candidatus Binatia bacterium]